MNRNKKYQQWQAAKQNPKIQKLTEDIEGLNQKIYNHELEQWKRQRREKLEEKQREQSRQQKQVSRLEDEFRELEPERLRHIRAIVGSMIANHRDSITPPPAGIVETLCQCERELSAVALELDWETAASHILKKHSRQIPELAQLIGKELSHV